MKISFLALFSISIFALHFAAFGQDTSRASATWRVQKYDLDVTLPLDERTRSIAVKATLNLKNVSPKPASTLTLRISTAADVVSVKINEAAADFTKGEEKINPSSNLQRIALRLPSVAPDAVLTATVEYKINLKENSALGAVASDYAQFLPLSFWYPTPNSWFFTGGVDAAPMSVSANGSSNNFISSGERRVNGRVQIYDQKLNGQPFFVSGKWDVSPFTDAGMPGEAFLPVGTDGSGKQNATDLHELASSAKTFVTEILGKPANFPQMRYVAVRRGAGFSSNGTLLIDEAVFRRPKIDALTAMNVAEAVAKVWLGGGSSVNGDGYGIVSEGLARYIATQFIERKFGRDVADVERLKQRNSYSAVSKRDAPLSKVSPLDDYYYPEVANKGAMLWRLLARRVGTTEFFSTVRANMQDGNLNVAELRAAFSGQKDIFDYLLNQVTDMNLLAGLPQVDGKETKVALRNTGAIDAIVAVTATTESGQKITAPATIKATDFGEVAFKSMEKVVRVEVDSEKLYPQSEYFDDVAPTETSDSDPLLAAKRLFDKQDFGNAESLARKLLRELPRCDEIRIFLARSLLSQNKNVEAEKEFRAVLDEKLPTAKSLAWADVGVGETASRANQKDAALKYAEAAILADADYGASLAARTLRNKVGPTSIGDAAVKSFFFEFDKAAAAKRKADLESMTISGEVTKFVSGAAGSAEQWQTQIVQIDRLDPNTILVEANMTVKLLGSNEASGIAVYRLVKVGNAWKMISVDMFEVR